MDDSVGGPGADLSSLQNWPHGRTDELADELRKLAQLVPLGSVWEHRKGHVIIVTGHCLLESTASPAVLYIEDGDLRVTWARVGTEFLDGRFTRRGGRPEPIGL